jgi:hypothetical protein
MPHLHAVDTGGGPNVPLTWIGLLKQNRETLALQEVGLPRIVEPLKHFLDEQRLLDAIRLGHVNVSERNGDVTPELFEMPQGQCGSVKV